MPEAKAQPAAPTSLSCRTRGRPDRNLASRYRTSWGDKDVDPASGVEPKDEEVTADYPRIGVELVSPEWFRRFEERPEDREANFKRVAWEARSAPASVSPTLSLEEDGVFQSELDASTLAGAQRSVVARVEDVVLGEPDPVVVEPGLADESRSSLIATDLKTDLVRLALPADDKSKVRLTLVAEDKYVNKGGGRDAGGLGERRERGRRLRGGAGVHRGR